MFIATLLLGPPVQDPLAPRETAPAVPTPPRLPDDDRRSPIPPELPKDAEPSATPDPETEPTVLGPSDQTTEVEPPPAAEPDASVESARPQVVLPPDFPASVDPYDETTWGDLTLEQKDRLRTLRASAIARAAEAAGHDDPTAVRDRAYARELRDVKEARRHRERDDFAQARYRGQVIAWSRPRLIGFGVSLGGGLLLSVLSVPIGARGRVGAAAAVGTIGALAAIVGLPGVIATALVRSAHLQIDDRTARATVPGARGFF